MLAEFGGQYRFKYRYLYYYFVANYMRDRIGEEEIQNNIGTMSRALYIDDNANILLFLAHLSKDPIIIEEMLEAANSLYLDVEAPATFTDDATFLSKVEEISDDFVYFETDVKSERRDMLEKMDQQKPQEEDDAPEKEGLQSNPVVQMNVALKTLQILGQILKNFVGSMEGKTKLRIARACVDLGLKANTSLFQLVHQNEEEIIRYIIEIVRGRYPAYRNEELQGRARKTITGMTRMASYSIVKRISHAVGSRDLEPVYQRLIEEHATPARELIKASITLDHTETDFPFGQLKTLAHKLKDNNLAIWILRRAVINHFQLFPVPFDVRQKTCEALGISYAGLQQTDPSRKLLLP
jgi:hypothetical protein